MTTNERRVYAELDGCDRTNPLPRTWLSKDLRRVADKMAAKGLIEKGHIPSESLDSRLVQFNLKEKEQGFTCECGRFHRFDSYVLAHWYDYCLHTCDGCEREHRIRMGRAELIKRKRKAAR